MRVDAFVLDAHPGSAATLEDAVPPRARRLLESDDRKAIPAIAKDADLMLEIESRVRALPTRHQLILGDSRDMDRAADESIHLCLTSPPYWMLKKYVASAAQLGAVEEYDAFLDELDRVWRQVHRSLVPGGRLVIVVGDVCVARRQFGRHVVFPLHASIQERCRAFGFDNLATIIWHKIANAQLETRGNGNGFLGKPYEPNAVVKNDIEFILSQRKPGGYRQPTPAMRVLSTIPEKRHREWFQQIWSLGGESTRNHPAPYPLTLAERIIRMFSFVGDTVLDPFSGTATTSVAAARWGRNSVAFEVEPSYHALAIKRIRDSVSQSALDLSWEEERP